MMSRSVLVMMFLCLAVTTLSQSKANAADWSYSPARAEISDADRANQAEDATATAADPMKKSVGKGVMFSLVIPGAGQLYSGSWLRALPWLAIEVVGWTMFASNHGKGQDKTDEFEAFAGPKNSPNNFNYNAYLMREYQVARNSNYTSTPYEGTIQEWKTESWDERQRHLNPPYGHDILTADVQQYFEMIGKYYEQFGYGWRDTYDYTTVDLENDWDEDVWAAGDYSDDPQTIQFDGRSPLFFQYADMRGEANDLLDKGNTMMEIVLANHVLSALDAAFAVRSHNKKYESGKEEGLLKLNYDLKTINGSTARFLTASIPLELTK